MSKTYIAKNIKLSLEFDDYLSKNPNSLKKIPNGACLVLTVRGDAKFNETSIQVAEKMRHARQKLLEVRKEGARWIFAPLAA